MTRSVPEAVLPATSPAEVLAARPSKVVAFWRAFRKKPLGLFGLIVLVVVVAVALTAPLVAPYGRDESVNLFFQSPTWAHPFGTDHLGRDVFSRVIYGASVSLQVGVAAVALGTLVGTAAGVVSGYFGRWVDISLQRVIDVLMALPGILLALTIAAALGASQRNVTIAIAIALLPASARVARGSTLSVKERQYVEAAHALGAGHVRIMLRHVLPNIMAPLIVIVSVQLGVAIIAEASLSYLGLGVPINVPTWGNMLSGAALSYMTKAPWMAIFPGVALTLVVLGINALGDALRDLLDPRMRGTQ
ncbi:MAG TPA: ABC transporter permease [Dehalococcoidia bacterium]|nr:ABC transporter permease [Dehalococcoidia bacterium]